MIRIENALSKDALKKLQQDFMDITNDGVIEQTGALDDESDERDLADMTRIVLRHKRRDFGRLRMLIDAINHSPIAK
mgnify:FL=1